MARKPNGGDSIPGRVSLLEKVWLEDRERWRKNDARWEESERKNDARWEKNDARILTMLKTLNAHMKEEAARWRKNDERWRKNDERLDAVLKTLHRLMEGR